MKSSNIAVMPQAHPFLREGIVRLNPAQAGVVLRENGYERNRDVERAQKHVAVLTETMRRGLWLPRDQIAFANLGGRLIMVNGHHRMAAQVASGVDIEWSVVIYPCDSDADVAALYARFDTNIRKRSDENVMSAMGVSDILGTTPTIARSVWRAAPMLANNLVAGKNDDYLSRHIADDRLAVVQSYAPEARAFQKAFTNAHMKASKKMLSGSVTAVAMVTLRARPQEAALFWRGMAENDGLRRGDPRATLLQWLQDNDSGRGSPAGLVYATARAWNAFYEGKELVVIRMSSTPLRIAGTSYVVSL